MFGDAWDRILVASRNRVSDPAMRLTCLVLVPSALVAALVPVLAQAASSTIPNQHHVSSLPWADVVRVRRFDPAQGQLVRARLTIDAFVRADLAVENLGETPSAVSAHAIALVTVQSPNGVPFAQLPFQTDVLWTTAAYDGLTDFAGASGRRAFRSGRQRAEVVIEDPALLLYFMGVPGAGGVVELPVSAFGSTAIVGGSLQADRAQLDAGVRVRVEYTTAQPTKP